MAYLDLKNSFLGLLVLGLFLGTAYLAWPALMPAFLALGFLLSAYRAQQWLKGVGERYQSLFPSGIRAPFDSLPFFLPLLFDLSMLTLLESLLRQAWFHLQRGSVLNALVIACFSTPILMIGARALAGFLAGKALRPFRMGGDASVRDT